MQSYTLKFKTLRKDKEGNIIIKIKETVSHFSMDSRFSTDSDFLALRHHHQKHLDLSEDICLFFKVRFPTQVDDLK